MENKFERASTGNNEGVEAVKEANDPLEQKMTLMRKSMKRRLKLKAFVDEMSESELIRLALEQYGV